VQVADAGLGGESGVGGRFDGGWRGMWGGVPRYLDIGRQLGPDCGEAGLGYGAARVWINQKELDRSGGDEGGDWSGELGYGLRLGGWALAGHGGCHVRLRRGLLRTCHDFGQPGGVAAWACAGAGWAGVEGLVVHGWRPRLLLGGATAWVGRGRATGALALR